MKLVYIIIVFPPAKGAVNDIQDHIQGAQLVSDCILLRVAHYHVIVEVTTVPP